LVLNATTCTTTGQCNSTETRHYLIDATEPFISINTPLDSTNYIYTEINITLTSSDSHLDTTWYNWNGTNVTYTSSINTTFFTRK